MNKEIETLMTKVLMITMRMVRDELDAGETFGELEQCLKQYKKLLRADKQKLSEMKDEIQRQFSFEFLKEQTNNND